MRYLISLASDQTVQCLQEDFSVTLQILFFYQDIPSQKGQPDLFFFFFAVKALKPWVESCSGLFLKLITLYILHTHNKSTTSESKLLWVNENTKVNMFLWLYEYIQTFVFSGPLHSNRPLLNVTHSVFESLFFFRQITKRSMTRRWRATTSAATKISTCSTVRKLRKWRARYASVLNGRRLRFFSVDKLFKNHRVASLKLQCVVLQQSYKAEYEDIKTRCFFPQTITPEYEAGKKLQGCSDVSSTSLLLFGTEP